MAAIWQARRIRWTCVTFSVWGRPGTYLDVLKEHLFYLVVMLEAVATICFVGRSSLCIGHICLSNLLLVSVERTTSQRILTKLAPLCEIFGSQSVWFSSLSFTLQWWHWSSPRPSSISWTFTTTSDQRLLFIMARTLYVTLPIPFLHLPPTTHSIMPEATTTRNCAPLRSKETDHKISTEHHQPNNRWLIIQILIPWMKILVLIIWA